MIVEETTLGGAPVMVVRAASAGPVVLWYHGFGADAATHRPELEKIASAGFIAVGVDAVGHGRRKRDVEVRAAVDESVSEIPAILDAIGEAPSFSIAGVSFGAFITYGAIVRELRFRSAVAMLGSPKWASGSSDAALLSITAENDTNVPPHDARAYANTKYIELPGETHFVSKAGWDFMIDETVKWFALNS